MKNPDTVRGLLTWNRREAELHFERSKAEQYIRPWREVAVGELRTGGRPSLTVLSLFLEACTSYERLKRKEVA